MKKLLLFCIALSVMAMKLYVRLVSLAVLGLIPLAASAQSPNWVKLVSSDNGDDLPPIGRTS